MVRGVDDIVVRTDRGTDGGGPEDKGLIVQK